MKIFIIVIFTILQVSFGEDDSNEILSVNVDGLLMNEADIFASSTCGMNGPEKYCRLVDEAYAMYAAPGPNILCDICDDRNHTKRHPIEYAKSDDQNLWWQSPSMAQGSEYQQVNITIDLKQVYQIVYILLKMADSPRPGTWILEKSLDGIEYSPWIFFADTPYSCFNLFQRRYPNIKLTSNARPQSLDDDEVFCTTHYSTPTSLIAGEIIISLINGRKSFLMQDNLAPRSIPLKLINFLSARYIRFRFLKLLTLSADLMAPKDHLEKSIYNRYFYSLKNIEVGGKCICNNHADKCDKVIKEGITVAKCSCKHNTCGNNCEKCCNMFNQKPWRQGLSCEECNCNGKSNKCVYNQTVATLQLSVNKLGSVDGGGMCLDCRENTAGVNCEKCKMGYYRPWDVLATSPFPCKSCICDGLGTMGTCISNGEELGNQKPGDCICKKGYKGRLCDECEVGYERKSNNECLACPCFVDGSVTTSLYSCKPPCNCKVNVEVSSNCSTCKQRFFNLDKNNVEGCQPCYCFGITDRCGSLNAMNIKVQRLKGWKVTSLSLEKEVDPQINSQFYPFLENSIADSTLEKPSVYYWLAPQSYLGNWLSSYKSVLQYVIKVEIERSITGSQIDSPDVVIKCGSIKMSHSVSSEDKRLHRNILIPLKEQVWNYFTSIGSTRLLSKDEFMSCLVNVQVMLIKGKYFTNQFSVGLLNVSLDRGDKFDALSSMPHIEKCECPLGFSGLSCESCEVGYRRVNKILVQGRCEACVCYQHSNSCDPVTNECKNCLHNTAGPHCDICSPGFYGNSRSGDKYACKKCSCPLEDYQLSNICSTFEQSKYICHDCTERTGGPHCERCIEGFYGNPLKMIPCKKCQCNDNEESCDSFTGQCLCSYNTMGARCELCSYEFFGNALKKNCQRCDCSTFGSKTQFCNKTTGQCPCKSYFSGLTCDKCTVGYYLSNARCIPCSCNKLGSVNSPDVCDSFTGKCFCKKGINGEMCDRCLPSHYGYPDCKKCGCSNHSLSSNCDLQNGTCNCGQNVLDEKCKTCKNNFYWSSQTSCSSCKCDIGSVVERCEMNTGQCKCSPHVVGRTCDKCDFNYYGLSSSGCKKCPECLDGKVCNNDGICVCPLNTKGEYCEKCADQSWGYDKVLGCKKCNCSKHGSSSQKCDIFNGQCVCDAQFKGLNCDKCSPDYFGFPNCRPCNCHIGGVLTDQLNICDPVNGSCPCKLNVENDKCNKCKNGTFGFDRNYKAGCYSCYCSGRTSKCSSVKDYRLISTGERIYQMYNDKQTFLPGKDQRIIKLSLRTPMRFGWPFSFFRPVFLDITDLITSPDISILYRKPLLTVDIDCESIGCGRRSSLQAEVFIESNGGSMELMYMVNHSKSNDSKFTVELSESSNHGEWFLIKYANHSLPKTVSLGRHNLTNLVRDVFIMALLNVTKVKIQLYTDKVNPEKIKMILETFAPIKTSEKIGQRITSVERCECDSKTTGLHCENPVYGYYNKPIIIPEVFFNISVRVGQRIVVNVEKCFCHGHSKECNKVTGYCYNCANNTAGPKCQECVEGFYGDPRHNGQCFKCECPSKEHNFATKCNRSSNSFVCQCKEGYSGILCERCKQGYFGDPINGIACSSCKCNPEGSLSLTCDDRGKCYCAPGVFGDKCDQCSENYVVEEKKCKNCLTGCTKELFIRIDQLKDKVGSIKWNSLPSKGEVTLQQISSKVALIKENLTNVNLLYKLGEEIKDVIVEFNKRKESLLEKFDSARILRDAYNETLRKILGIFKDIEETVNGGKPIEISKEGIINVTSMLKEVNELKRTMPKLESVENDLLIVKNHLDNINEKKKTMQDIINTDKLNNVKELVLKTKLAEEINKDNKKYVLNLRVSTDANEMKLKEYQKKVNSKNEEYKIIIQKKELLFGNITKLKQLSKEFEEKINMTFSLMEKIEKLLQGLSHDIPLKEFVIPKSVTELVNNIVNQSREVIKNLLKSFEMMNKAKDAKDAYSYISRNIEEVEQAIKSTRRELEDSKNQLRIDKFSININDILKNQSDIAELKQSKQNNFKKLNDEHNNLKDKGKLLEKRNMDRVSKISIETYQTIDLYRNISSIKIKQDENQITLDSLSKTLQTFEVPKGANVDVTGIELKMNNLNEKYNGIKKETDSVIVSIKELQENIRKLRKRLRKSSIYRELAHGAAAKSPEPIRLAKDCVRHYQTYFLPKSNAFSLELYLNPQFPKEQNLVLFGYDNSGRINKSFALTIEKNQQVKFWYDYGTVPYELNVDSSIFTPSNYTGLLISWNLGKWEMKHKSLFEDSQVGTYFSNKTSLNNILLGPESHIFLGGFPSDKLLKKAQLELGGELVKKLKENYRTKYYKGCIYGVKLMNFDLGLQDFHNVEDECGNSDYAFFLLKQSFTCKISQSNTGNVEAFKHIIRRQKRNSNKNYNIHFNGQGYVMINMSEVKKEGLPCAKLFNKALRIDTFPQLKINSQSFQLVSVFMNDKLDIGYILGQKDGKFQLGYWNRSTNVMVKSLNVNSDSIIWKTFSKNNDLIFGVNEVCHPSSLMYLGGIPLAESQLRDKLKKLQVPYLSYTGSMKISVVNKELFKKSSTRFVSKNLRSEREVNLFAFHYLFVPDNLQNPILLDIDNYDKTLTKGFSFNVDFLGLPITKDLTILSIESSQSKLSLKVSPNLEFTVTLNNETIGLQSWDVDDKWGTYFVVVNLQLKAGMTEIYLTVNEPKLNMKEFRVKMDPKVTKIEIGQKDFQQSFYLYDVFLGERLVNFNAPGMAELPVNSYLKLTQSQLSPSQSKFLLPTDRIQNEYRVSSRHETNLQSDAVALPYKGYLYISSLRANNYNLPSFQSEEYPDDSGWFEGSMVSINNGILNKYLKPSGNKISFRLSSYSNRPEIILSINFGLSKTLNIITMDRQIVLFDPLTNWSSTLLVEIIDKEWHMVELMPYNPEENSGIIVTIDRHSFNFPYGPFSFTKPLLIEIGGYSSARPDLYYNGKYHKIGRFTGCLDTLKINEHKASLRTDTESLPIKQCAKVLEYLDNGMEINGSYVNINVPSELVKLEIEHYKIQGKRNSLIIEFKFKYTGFEVGSLLITGDNSRFCAIVISKRKLNFNCKNFITNYFSSDSINLKSDKWYKVEFHIFHMVNIITIFKVEVDDMSLNKHLSGPETYSVEFIRPEIFLGGHPNLNINQKVSLTNTDRNFVGCMSGFNVRIYKTYVASIVKSSPHVISGRCSIDKFTYLRKL